MPEPTMAFLGCGAAALMHSRTLAKVAPRLPRLYASRIGEKARSFSESYGGSGWFDGYESALADPHISVVVVTTPPATHFALARQALQAGKHVVVEKPAFLTTAELDDIAALAAAADRQVLVAENYYYKPIAFRLRELIATGAIGELKLVWLNATKQQRVAGWRCDPLLAGGGPLFEGGVHWINVLAHLGPEIESIECEECGGPMTTVTRVRYRGGAIGLLAYSWELKSRLNGVHMSRMYGSHGSVAFETNGIFALLRGPRARVLLPGLRDLMGRRAMWLDFMAALKQPRAPQFTLARARVDVALLERALAGSPAEEKQPWIS